MTSKRSEVKINHQLILSLNPLSMGNFLRQIHAYVTLVHTSTTKKPLLSACLACVLLISMGFSQKIALSVKNVPLTTVFKQIEKQKIGRAHV